MKRTLAACLIIGFTLWVLPLGYFIKPSQQKLACDGQRAICMCYAMGHRSSDKAMEPGITLKAASSSNKENSSGGGSYFISAKPAVVLDLRLASIFEDQFLSYQNPYLATSECVPKF